MHLFDTLLHLNPTISLHRLLYISSYLFASILVPMFVIIMQEFRHGRKHYLTYHTLRTARSVPPQYRSVELIHKQLMEITGLAMVLIHGFFSQFIIFANFSILKHWDSLDSDTKVCVNNMQFLDNKLICR